MIVSAPDNERLSGQRGLHAAFLLDVVMVSLLIIVGMGTGSHILVSVAALSLLTLFHQIGRFVIHRRAMRGALVHYEFGIGKLEQLINLVISLLMSLVGLWLARGIFGSLLIGAAGAPQQALVLAALACALYTLRLACVLWSSSAAGQSRDTLMQAGDASTSRSSLTVVIVALLAITLAALTKDPLLARWMDTAAALFIALALVLSGVKISWSAVLDLVDHPLEPADEAKIKELLSDFGIDTARLQDIRARRAGGDLFVELTLQPEKDDTFVAVQNGFAGLRRHLEANLAGADVVVKLS